MTASTVIAIIGCVLSVSTFFIGRMTAAKSSGQTIGALQSDLGYIRAGIDDLKRDNRQNAEAISSINVRLARVEESVASAHKRIDGLGRREE